MLLLLPLLLLVPLLLLLLPLLLLDLGIVLRGKVALSCAVLATHHAATGANVALPCIYL